MASPFQQQNVVGGGENVSAIGPSTHTPAKVSDGVNPDSNQHIGGIQSGHDPINPEIALLPVEPDEPNPPAPDWENFIDIDQVDGIYYEDLEEELGSPSPQRANSKSYVTSEHNGEEALYFSDEEVTSMILMGCPGCLIYKMSSEEAPKCPDCKGTMVLASPPTTPPP